MITYGVFLRRDIIAGKVVQITRLPEKHLLTDTSFSAIIWSESKSAEKVVLYGIHQPTYGIPYP